MSKIRSSSPSLGYLILAIVVAFGVGVGIVRLINGLGSTTALSDNYPWGLWILYDVFFVSFSAGAFMILAITHIYGREEYHAIARPVVLAGFLGEVMVIAVLVMDLGRWNQFYNVLFPWYWNIHSFMFQVSICLTIYMAVMVLEVAPAFLERLNWRKPLRYIRGATIVISCAGIVLSALHQSSLGSLFLLMPYKIHPLWWTPWLPLLFFTSATFAGLSMAILVVTVSFRVFHRPLDLKLLSKLAQVMVFLLGIYLVLKVVELLFAGELGMMFTEGWYSVLFWGEIGLGVIVPMVLFSMRRVRESQAGLIWGAACALGGVALNRTNVALLGYEAPGAATYIPNWMEIVISVAAVAAGILLFALAVRFLPILPQADGERAQAQRPEWSRRVLVFVGGALSLLTIAVVLLLQPLTQAQAIKVEPAAEPEAALIPACSCTDCHLDLEALVEAGAGQDNLAALQIELQPAEMPHSKISCIACHYGDRAATETEVAHQDMIRDPTAGEADVCIACHQDLPDEFPEDRLRTPHDQVTHGQITDVLCSDCHGAVGHGFDPVSHGIICPMSVCLDCHVARNLDSELSDCEACHIGPHDPAPAQKCASCHQSTDVWQQVTVDSHPLELTGAHARAQCTDCHPELSFEQLPGTECAACHQAPDANHYGPQCEDCHSPAGFEDARLPAEMHPFPLQGAHQVAACEGCHAADQSVPEFVCSNCHNRPENHLPGECSLCHTPQGWAESIAYVVDLSPQISHEVEGRQDCLMCHSLAGEIAPAPSNHGDYINEQCVLCHKTP